MQGTFIGFNTAGITFEEHFLALLGSVRLIIYRPRFWLTFY